MIGYDEIRKTYYVQIEYKDPVSGKRKNRKKRGFALKREARQYEAELFQKLTSEAPTDRTFGQMVDLYMTSIDARESTKALKKQTYKNHCESLCDIPMSKITKATLMEWSNNLKNSSLALLTVNRIIGDVRSVFKYASRVYDLKDISSVITRKKKTSDDLKEMQAWTVAEFKQFENAVDNPVYRAFFHTLFWTGARRGEILALQCDDFKNGEINISKSINHLKNGFNPLKNANSKRIVKLDEKTVEILAELKDKYKTGFLFGGETFPSPGRVRGFLKRAIKKSGVKKIRLHDLRHSHATMLINSGVNIVAVSKRLGHSDINTTLKVYTHLLKKTDEQMMETIKKLAK
ncbi:MAG: tyrosine-type recombinase/integrase [Bulleidia sp.]